MSSGVADEHHVVGHAASREGELFAVVRPGEIEDPSALKVGRPRRLPAVDGLAPGVGEIVAVVFVSFVVFLPTFVGRKTGAAPA